MRYSTDTIPVDGSRVKKYPRARGLAELDAGSSMTNHSLFLVSDSSLKQMLTPRSGFHPERNTPFLSLGPHFNPGFRREYFSIVFTLWSISGIILLLILVLVSLRPWAGFRFRITSVGEISRLYSKLFPLAKFISFPSRLRFKM